MKTAIRELYEEAVYKAWKAYDDEIVQISRAYQEAFELGRVERDDKTFAWKNTAMAKAWQKLDENLKSLWSRYLATKDGGLELKAIIIHGVKVSPCVYIPQTDSGSYMIAKINTRNLHACYIEVEKVIKPSGLYCFKMHNGYLVLVADDDPLLSKLFTLPPYEVAKAKT